MIVHIEFQKGRDVNMGLRTWEYNCATTIVEKLPVRSFVIYLVEDEPIVEPPFRIMLDENEAIHTFNYTNIFLWEVAPEVLKQKGMEGLLPLLPLTKGAKSAPDTIVQDMITGLRNADKEDILALGYACAGMVYDSEEDRQALRRIFAMLENKLERSWYYKEVIEKGMQQGIERGIEQGELRALRPMLIQVVETRFPELLPLAREEAERSTVPAVLSTKVTKLLRVQTLEEARQVLQKD
jgi:predicted transposase YdaD